MNPMHLGGGVGNASVGGLGGESTQVTVVVISTERANQRRATPVPGYVSRGRRIVPQRHPRQLRRAGGGSLAARAAR